MALVRPSFLVIVALLCLSSHGDAKSDYAQALTKSMLFFEAQRSGKLPPDQRVQWRGDSALYDGKDAGVNLTGGYYDAGDNVKFGFPMAFTVTMLSLSVIEYSPQLKAKKELRNAVAAIKWGTDYFLKAHVAPDVLYAEVGDGDSDHECWERPEDMTTPRTAYMVNRTSPGSDLAAETAAALAAASIVFHKFDPAYSTLLVTHAKQLFDFADKNRALYQNSIPVVSKFYTSSGYNDELQWAGMWLFVATGDRTFANYVHGFPGGNGGTRTLFGWDDKWTGVQFLVYKMIIKQKLNGDNGVWSGYGSSFVGFMCSVLQKAETNVKMSPGGMLWWQPWNNFQYTTAALLLAAAHADHLTAVGANLNCPHDVTIAPAEIIAFVRSQVDYILGANPKKMSYMVGYGTSYPSQLHHRGASIVSIKQQPAPVTCQQGFSDWFNKAAPNPNVLDGALVGGPDANDGYTDSRSNFQQGEAPTVNVAPLVGILARLASR